MEKKNMDGLVILTCVALISAIVAAVSYRQAKERELYRECLRITEKAIESRDNAGKFISLPDCRL